MKKNKFIVFYVILASILFVGALSFLGFNLFNEYNHGYERTKRRFDHMANNIKKLSETEYSSMQNYKADLEKVIGETSDFAYLEIKEDGKTIFIYPDAAAKSNIDSNLIKNYNTYYKVNNVYIYISADLYTLRPYSIFYYARITFFAVLIITLITAILIIYYNLNDKSKAVVESESFEQEDTENTSLDEDEVHETEFEEPVINEELNESEPEQDEEFVAPKEKLSLSTGDFEPVKIETLNEISNTPKGLFSPDTGLGWEEYLSTRLTNELNRAISSELDLALFLLKIPGVGREDPKIQKCCEYLIEQFQFKDLLFEYKEDSIAIIKINESLENALSLADKLYVDIKNILGNDLHCYIGITTRTLRMLSSERLLLEADEALVHAQENPEDPIIAFRANAEKYRQFMENN